MAIRSSFQGKNEKIVLCHIPHRKELCAIHLKIQNRGTDDDSTGGAYRKWQNDSSYSKTIWKCRELIFTENVVLASTEPDTLNAFVAIVPKSYLNNTRFLNSLDKHNLKIDQRVSLTSAIFEMCLKFTIFAKISPLWNKVGNLLIEGSNFLDVQDRLNGIEFSVNVREDEACISLAFYNVKMADLKLEELIYSPIVASDFLTLKAALIDENSFKTRWCHVLPSMKKGEICFVTRKIPPGSIFDNYEEMKAYWKQTYGYILPENESGQLYYNMFFRMLGTNTFIYPSCCLKLHEPIKVPQMPLKVEENLAKILQDLTQHVPTICGQQWMNQAVMLRPMSQLQAISANQLQQMNGNFNEKLSCITLSSDVTNAKEPKPVPQVQPVVSSSQLQTHFGSLAMENVIPNPSFVSNLNSNSIVESSQSQQVSASCSSQAQNTLMAISSQMARDSVPSPYSMPNTLGDMQLQVNFVTNSASVKRQQKVINDKSKKQKSSERNSNEDIVRLAQENKLSKTNKSSLFNWLNEMGFQCSSKLSKAELINRVKKAVEMLEPEQ